MCGNVCVVYRPYSLHHPLYQAARQAFHHAIEFQHQEAAAQRAGTDAQHIQRKVKRDRAVCNAGGLTGTDIPRKSVFKSRARFNRDRSQSYNSSNVC